MQQYEQKGVCPYDCPDACGFLAATDGKQIFSVKGDPSHPTTCGFLCRKMRHYEQDIHHPDRILTPLKRVGKKGDPHSFLPVSWEEAIQTICKTWHSIIQKEGSDAILPYSYAGTMGLLQRHCGDAFFARLGAANLERTICCSAKDAGFTHAMGSLRDWNSPQLATSDFILLWGANPKVNQLHTLPWLQKAKERGAKIIQIDVYQNQSSDLCEEVLCLRPGTDAALILAMMSELENGGYLDMDFLQTHTTGCKELASLYRTWSAEKAEPITGIPAVQIKKLAREYGQAKRSLILTGNGMARYTNSSAMFHLLYSLPALTGAWQRGGGTSGTMGSSDFLNKAYITRPDWIRDGLQTYNMNQLGLALHLSRTDTSAPAIKSLYVYHSNPAVMAPDQQQVLRGLKREDLFLVVHDRFLTDTALYADFVLPATFSVEQDDLYSSYGHYHLQTGWKIIDPPGTCKSNWDTFRLLAKGMGFSDDYWKISAREFIETRLTNYQTENFFRFPLVKSDIESLRKGDSILLPQADVMDFQTEDKKIHLHPLGNGYIPLKDQTYPLRLVMVHSPWTLNSNFSTIEELLQKRGSLRLRIHPAEAKIRNLKNGELCHAYNNYGQIKVQVECSESVCLGTAIAEGVYRGQDTWDGYNFSSLIGEELTDSGKAAPLNTYTIELKK